MGKLLATIGMVIITLFVSINFTACEKYNDDELWNKVNELDNRVNILEAKVNSLNNEISSLQNLYKALDKRLYIISVENITNGTRITFSDGSKTTITNGIDGTNGTTPLVNAALYNGAYYWTQTINGATTWVTDTNGNKIPTTGADAVTPLLKVSSDGYWMISYNKGNSYSYIIDFNSNYVKAVGTDGENGKNGESFFESVTIKNSQLVLTLLDETIIMLPLDNATVVKSHAKVDMGLSVKWATTNVGAEAPHETGIYCLWGDGTGTLDWDIYDNYSKNKSSYNITATSRDLAHMKWGNGWRTPTYGEFSELIRNTSRSVVVINGMKCLKLTSSINGNHIIMPANGSQYTSGWSSSTGHNIKYMKEGIDCYYMTSTASDITTPQSEYLYCYIFNYSTSNLTWNFSQYMIGGLKVGVRPVIS